MKNISIYSLKQVKEKSGIYNVDNANIDCPEAATAIINQVFQLDEEAVEKFIILTLTTKKAVAGIHVISVGTLNSSLVHPREVFKAAILNNSASIILVHNHPSGDPTPSPEDLDVTRRLREAGKIMGIEVLDHLIIGDSGRFASLRKKGLFN